MDDIDFSHHRRAVLVQHADGGDAVDAGFAGRDREVRAAAAAGADATPPTRSVAAPQQHELDVPLIRYSSCV